MKRVELPPATMDLVIVGAGYVGLVSAACFADIGHRVTCVDCDERKIASLKGGVAPIYEPGLDELIAENVRVGRLGFSTTIPNLAAPRVDALFIAVGTPPRAGDQGADLSSVFSVAMETARLASGHIVLVNKSTVPVGAGDAVERMVRSAAPNLEVSVVSNPEFLREGDAIADFMTPDRVIVGAEDERGRAVLEHLYAPLTRRGVRLLVTRRRAAELVKYASNAFLATKISFINEMADLCEAVDADITDVALGIGLDRRIGAEFLKAGPGFGGSCFPKDCAALLTTAQDHAVDLRIVESALAANQLRKRLMARKVVKALGGEAEGRTVAILGLTFKAETDDMRDAPAIVIVDALRQAGAMIRVYDPQGMDHARDLLGDVTYASSALECCEGADAIVLVTEWREFHDLDFRELASVARGRQFIDLRNHLDPAGPLAAGFTVTGVGRASRAPAARPVPRLAHVAV